jgi:hypothetical protein
MGQKNMLGQKICEQWEEVERLKKSWIEATPYLEESCDKNNYDRADLANKILK